MLALGFEELVPGRGSTFACDRRKSRRRSRFDDAAVGGGARARRHRPSARRTRGTGLSAALSPLRARGALGGRLPGAPLAGARAELRGRRAGGMDPPATAPRSAARVRPPARRAVRLVPGAHCEPHGLEARQAASTAPRRGDPRRARRRGLGLHPRARALRRAAAARRARRSARRTQPPILPRALRQRQDDQGRGGRARALRQCVARVQAAAREEARGAGQGVARSRVRRRKGLAARRGDARRADCLARGRDSQLGPIRGTRR